MMGQAAPAASYYTQFKWNGSMPSSWQLYLHAQGSVYSYSARSYSRLLYSRPVGSTSQSRASTFRNVDVRSGYLSQTFCAIAQHFISSHITVLLQGVIVPRSHAVTILNTSVSATCKSQSKAKHVFSQNSKISHLTYTTPIRYIHIGDKVSMRLLLWTLRALK